VDSTSNYVLNLPLPIDFTLSNENHNPEKLFLIFLSKPCEFFSLKAHLAGNYLLFLATRDQRLPGAVGGQTKDPQISTQMPWQCATATPLIIIVRCSIDSTDDLLIG